MDDRKQPKSLSTRDRGIDADAAPPDAGSQRSTVVYFAGAEDISDGFAIALHAMGFDEILLSDLIPNSDITSNPEER